MTDSKKLVWDAVGGREYETGVSKGVLFPGDGLGGYEKGVAWNGLTAVTQSPSGAESTPLYADNIKYLNLISAEEFAAKVEAYMYPDEFAECDGSAEIAPGVLIGQQTHKMFGLSYVTRVGNDTDADLGYLIHVVYGATAKPSERAYKTVNDKPEAITFSWDLTTVPIAVDGFKPTAILTIDSTKFTTDPEKALLASLEAKLWGTELVDPSLPTPDEIVALITDHG